MSNYASQIKTSTLYVTWSALYLYIPFVQFDVCLFVSGWFNASNDTHSLQPTQQKRRPRGLVHFLEVQLENICFHY